MSGKETKVVNKTVQKTASPAPTVTAKSSSMEEWFKFFLKSRHGSKEDRRAAQAELVLLEAELLKQL